MAKNKKLKKIEIDNNFKMPDDGKIKPIPKNQNFITSLAQYISEGYEEAKKHRNSNGIDDKLILSLQQYKGIYNSLTQAEIDEVGGTDVYRKLTMMKSDNLASWLEATFNPNNEELPWNIEPTPLPDIPNLKKQNIAQQTATAAVQQFAPLLQQGMEISEEEISQWAFNFAIERKKQEIELAFEMSRDSAEAMKKLLRDQQIEGKFDNVFQDCITNFTIYQNAFLKGPIFKMEKQLDWDEIDGKTVVKVKNEPKMTWECPNPFDIYPSPNAKTIQDGDLYERIFFSRKDLSNLKGLKGYSSKEINKVLEEGLISTTLSESTDSERAELENRETAAGQKKDSPYEGVIFWGSVLGKLLKEWGMKEIEDISQDYNISAIKIGDYVIKATLNEDPLGKRPYSMASFKEVPGSFWGVSLPETMEDIQSECNSAIRALCNNMALASGPMIAYDISQLPAGENITKLFPWKTFQFDSRAANNSGIKAVDFLNPPSHAQELLAVYNNFKSEADDVTNIPAFAAGGSTQGTGAGETMGGLAMLQGNMTKSIKKLISRISNNIIKPTIERQFNWNIQNSDDENIKGDIRVSVKGPLATMVKEQIQMRRQAYLDSTNNPTDLQIVGINGRANLLRKIAQEDLDMASTEVVPSKEKIEQKLQEEKEQELMQLQAIQQQSSGGERKLPVTAKR